VAAALAHALAAAGVGPLTATSLNRHGEPPARTRAEAARLCPPGDPLAPRLVATGEAGPGPAPTAGLASGGAAGPAPARDGGPVRPSTVVDCTGTPPRVLREGAIGADAIARVLAGGAR
jgi:tRNA A37 threonylcarbamoyladenosine synthetase subunit TsaC/SUA5/YrdC